MLKTIVANLFKKPIPTETLRTAIPDTFWNDGWIKMGDIQEAFTRRKTDASISPEFSTNFSIMMDAAIGSGIQKEKLPFFAPDKDKILPLDVYVSGQNAVELIQGRGLSTAAVIGYLQKRDTDKDLEQVYRCTLQGLADLIEQGKIRTTQEMVDDKTLVDCRQSGSYRLTTQEYGSSFMFILKRNSSTKNQAFPSNENVLKPQF